MAAEGDGTEVVNLDVVSNSRAKLSQRTARSGIALPRSDARCSTLAGGGFGRHGVGEVDRVRHAQLSLAVSGFGMIRDGATRKELFTLEWLVSLDQKFMDGAHASFRNVVEHREAKNRTLSSATR